MAVFQKDRFGSALTKNHNSQITKIMFSGILSAENRKIYIVTMANEFKLTTIPKITKKIQMHIQLFFELHLSCSVLSEFILSLYQLLLLCCHISYFWNYPLFQCFFFLIRLLFWDCLKRKLKLKKKL